MEVKASIKALLQNQVLHQSRPLQFQLGQIFYGTVQKLFPNHHAEIRLGNDKLIAKLEVPLTIGTGHWLQVSSNEGETKLKLLNQNIDSVSNKSLQENLLRQLSLPNDKLGLALAGYLMKEHIPLTKEDIHKSVQLLKLTDNLELGLNTLKLMHEKNSPFNEAIFKSLIAAGTEVTTNELIKSLRTSLSFEQTTTHPVAREILSLLQSIEQHTSGPEKQYGRQEALMQIKQAVKYTGLFYERTLLNDSLSKDSFQESIKPLLVKFLHETQDFQHPKSRDFAEQLLYRMNGLQLLSTQDGPIQQMIYELPINIAGHQTELTMQWSGKKTAEGKINPDFCRIVFYLELEHLKETVIDMQVQNRVVTINIINENNSMKRVAEQLLPLLKSGLKEMDYHLSAVFFKQPESSPKQKENTSDYFQKSRSYNGVDIRI
ncbi:hypothetical protein [Lederbergia citrea]|uniref:Flagellar hook-length control protein-like C-terminal domain-containing protein n=1 Tax=Lederbergia citrea TaxID=2833581 RepID=A0A942UMV5_9BACI|nr:hypothetical protein [Lederbergia citrea]MBS4177139.1 hypothetical protein [Lederbergia citrea]MBS4221613.1 hypothetical protein [Lederbergia citrea]